MPTDWHWRIAPYTTMKAEGFKYADDSALAHRALQDRKGPQLCVPECVKLPNRFNTGNYHANSLATTRCVLQGRDWPYNFIGGKVFFDPDVALDYCTHLLNSLDARLLGKCPSAASSSSGGMMSAPNLYARKVYSGRVGLRGLRIADEIDPGDRYGNYRFAGRSGAPVLTRGGTGLGLRTAPRPRGGASVRWYSPFPVGLFWLKPLS